MLREKFKFNMKFLAFLGLFLFSVFLIRGVSATCSSKISFQDENGGLICSGDTLNINLEFKENGVLKDPSSYFVSLTKPSGTSDISNLFERDSEGKYSVRGVIENSGERTVSVNGYINDCYFSSSKSYLVSSESECSGFAAPAGGCTISSSCTDLDCRATVNFNLPWSDSSNAAGVIKWGDGDSDLCHGDPLKDSGQCSGSHTYSSGGTYTLEARFRKIGVTERPSCSRVITVGGGCTPDCTGKECGDDGCGGSCGTCSTNEVCSNYQCVCKSGYTRCSGSCVDIDTDPNNCGSCGNTCSGSQTCQNGQCVNQKNPSCSISVSPTNPQIDERISINVTYSDMDSGSKYFSIGCGNNQNTNVGPCTGTSGSCSKSNQCSYSSSGTYTVSGYLPGSVSCSSATVNVQGANCQNGVNQNTGKCDSTNCGADSSCDGKAQGDSCGSGKTCDSSCKCVSGGGKQIIADFTWSPQTPIVGEEVTFDASASKYADGSSIQNAPGVYTWDMDRDGQFGKYTYESGITPRYTFTSAGKYNIPLKIDDKQGNTATTTKTITVVEKKCPDCQSSGIDSCDNKCEVNCGADSSCDERSIGASCGSGKICDSSCKCVSGGGKQIIADFTWSPQNPKVNQEVSFDASASRYSDGSSIQNAPGVYTWDMDGDGQFGKYTYESGITPRYTFKKPGSYSITLKIDDKKGNIAYKTKTITIAPAEEKCPSSPSKCTTDEIVKACAGEYSVGDRTGEFMIDCIQKWIHLASCRQTYEIAPDKIKEYDSNSDGKIDGSEAIKAIQDWVNNNDPNDDQIGAIINFHNKDCDYNKIESNQHANVKSDIPSTGSVNSKLNFDAYDSSDPDGEITEYKWDFGDGTTAEGATTTHKYSKEGNYIISVSVTDDVGDTSVFIKEISVGGAKPKEIEEHELFNLNYGWNMVYFNAKDVNSGVIFSHCGNPLVIGLDENQKLYKLGKGNEIEGGKGYLIRINNKCKLTTTMETYPKDKLVLKKGWNFMGLEGELSVDKLKGVCGSTTLVVGLNNEQMLYKEGSVMKGKEGYLIRVPKDCTYDLRENPPA